MPNSCQHGKACTQRNCIEIVPIFSNLTYEEMLEVAAITTDRTYEKGEMIYMAGDIGGKLYVLHTGRIKISRLSANGKEQVLRVIGPGESMLLTDNSEALETSTMCMIEGEKLKELMKKYPSISFKVMEELSRRLSKAENLIEDINLSTVEQRLARSLLELSSGKREVVLKMTKGDFASQIGMSQETLSRKLAVFQDEGLIELKGHRKILIRDRAGLEMVSSD